MDCQDLNFQATRMSHHCNLVILLLVDVIYCSLQSGLLYCSNSLLLLHSTLLLVCANQAWIQQPSYQQYKKLMHTCHLDPLLYTVTVWRRCDGGGVTLNILHIMHILLIVMNSHASHRREVLKQWATNFSLPVYEPFAFATSETVSITSGNKLIEAVGNVSIFWMITFSLHDSFCTGWFWSIRYWIQYVPYYVRAAKEAGGEDVQVFGMEWWSWWSEVSQ